MQTRHGMEWNDLRVFLAVAREGSLGAAANPHVPK
ncbi:LysR family transcriptional regulator [Dokdonella fugitiva]|jgi:DNA-binding transcriptional LysR family regulator|nr:LysR family transcriptional regulator [Dokdonella fugitiva]MBA8883332.1 DNA-binding transcriptional LysR family regulator [Dokdonella fugitiva]